MPDGNGRRVESMADAARLLGVHPKTIDRWIKTGTVKLHHRDELGRKYIDVATVGADIIRRARVMQEARYPDKPTANPQQQELMAEVSWLRDQLDARDRQISDLIALVTKLTTEMPSVSAANGGEVRTVAQVGVTPHP